MMTESLLGLIVLDSQTVDFLVGLRITEEAPGMLPSLGLWGVLLGIIFLVVAGMVAGAYDEPVHVHFDNFGVWHLE